MTVHQPLRRIRLTCMGLLLGAGGAHAATSRAEDCRLSAFVKATSAEQTDRAAAAQYTQWLERAREQKALAPPGHPQLVRLRHVLGRLVTAAEGCNERARDWNWEIHLIGSRSHDLRSLPGGKLVVFYGLLGELQVDDDELAFAVAQLMAQALLEQARERAGHSLLVREATAQGTLLGLQFTDQQVLRADRVGLSTAARAGYDPAAALRLLRKLRPTVAAPASAPALGTPLMDRRPPAIEALLPAAAALYEAAPKPTQRFAPPARPND